MAISLALLIHLAKLYFVSFSQAPFWCFFFRCLSMFSLINPFGFSSLLSLLTNFPLPFSSYFLIYCQIEWHGWLSDIVFLDFLCYLGAAKVLPLHAALLNSKFLRQKACYRCSVRLSKAIMATSLGFPDKLAYFWWLHIQRSRYSHRSALAFLLVSTCAHLAALSNPPFLDYYCRTVGAGHRLVFQIFVRLALERVYY